MTIYSRAYQACEGQLLTLTLTYNAPGSYVGETLFDPKVHLTDTVLCAIVNIVLN